MRTQAILAALIILVVVSGVYFGYQLLQQMALLTAKEEYSENLNVYFRIINGTSGQAITSGVTAKLYSADANPMARQAAQRGDPIATATYDSTVGAWSIGGIDAGSYKLLVYYGSNTYPTLVDVTVNPTTDPDRETWLKPGTIYLYARASITITSSIEAYNETTNSWTSVSNMNVTSYDKWRVTYTIKISGVDDTIIQAPIRFYFTEIDELSITSCKLDGAEKALELDEETASDGIKGYYFEVTENMEPGDIHTVVLVIEETGTITSSTTFTFTFADYYTCQYTTLKFWSYSTSSITVTP